MNESLKHHFADEINIYKRQFTIFTTNINCAKSRFTSFANK